MSLIEEPCGPSTIANRYLSDSQCWMRRLAVANCSSGLSSAPASGIASMAMSSISPSAFRPVALMVASSRSAGRPRKSDDSGSSPSLPPAEADGRPGRRRRADQAEQERDRVRARDRAEVVVEPDDGVLVHRVVLVQDLVDELGIVRIEPQPRVGVSPFRVDGDRYVELDDREQVLHVRRGRAAVGLRETLRPVRVHRTILSVSGLNAAVGRRQRAGSRAPPRRWSRSWPCSRTAGWRRRGTSGGVHADVAAARDGRRDGDVAHAAGPARPPGRGGRRRRRHREGGRRDAGLVAGGFGLKTREMYRSWPPFRKNARAAWAR